MTYNEDSFTEEDEEDYMPACTFCDHDEESVCCQKCEGREFDMPEHPAECKCQKLTKEQQEKLTPPTSFLRNPPDYLQRFREAGLLNKSKATKEGP